MIGELLAGVSTAVANRRGRRRWKLRDCQSWRDARRTFINRVAAPRNGEQKGQPPRRALVYRNLQPRQEARTFHLPLPRHVETCRYGRGSAGRGDVAVLRPVSGQRLRSLFNTCAAARRQRCRKTQGPNCVETPLERLAGNIVRARRDILDVYEPTGSTGPPPPCVVRSHDLCGRLRRCIVGRLVR